MSMRLYDVIKKPVLNTEKARDLMQNNEFVFIVDRRANKIEIKKAVEELFEVKVKSVNVLNVKAKTARSRMTMYTIPSYKKAIVKLAEGQVIKAFEQN
ncbi:50S ribosomal protein L25 [Oceanivirga miroungae]|uniref:Large ribosomal subunit protein uL23 n=2 Tax=Oceanivirga miroungae TaxID=1130046 RepID=A0A6I8MCL3_9FUSO|nr:50S ribosomal protein L25 [Oceanivirga miroungae]